MYEQSSCPGAESNSIKDTDKPDEFGLILNDKKYRGKVRAPKDGVYVNENLALALRQVLQQQSTLKEAAQIYDVDQTTMCRKLRELKKRRFSNSNLPSLQFKTAGSEQIKEKKIHSFVNMESFPQISVHNSIQKIIRKMNQANQVSFPRSFNECIKRIEGGENVEEMIQYYALNKVVAVKIIRFLKQAKKSSRSVYDILVKKVASLLPYLNGSNSPSVSPCKDAQSFMQVTTKHVIPQSTSRFVSYTSQDLKKAIDYYNSGGSSIKYVSAKFNVPYGRLCKSLRKTEQVMEKWKKPDASPDHSQSLSPSSSSAIMGCVGAVSKVTSCKSPKEKHAQKTLCLFCHGKAGNEVELGKLHILNKIIVHYYCLLFSSALEQNGQDDEGILGFLPKDILKELKRGKKLKCFHCRKNGATIGCYRKNCKRVYHFPCGLQNHAQFVFTDNFRSLCPNHRKFQRANNIDQEVECPICLQVMVADPKIAVWAPCCKKSSWFHKICIQRLALHAGYFFKCPLCNDKDTFIPEMRQNGIYVPEQDASWELEPNAYQELLERPIRCLAEVCKCPGGRKNDEEGTTWEVVLCNLCGSSGVHVSCGKLRRGQSTWNCNTCTTMLKECELRKQSLGRISLQEKRAEVDSGSDEEVQFPSARKRRRTDFHLNSPHIIKISYSSHDEHVVVDSDSGTDVSPQDLARASSSGFRPLSRCGAVKENKGVIGMDDDVFVPRSISGNVMIADLVQRGEIPLPECLLDLKTYAEGFPLKLNKLRFDEDTFLLKLREVSSESKSDPPYEVTKEHLSRFVRCTFTYDQMRLLRKVFELCFIIHEFKLKISRYQKNVRNDPFKTRRRTGNRNPSLVKKVKGLQMKLVSLLSQASEVNLLEAYNTWTQYDSTSNKYWTSVASSHSRNLTTDGIASTSSDIPSASSSARYASLKAVSPENETLPFLDLEAEDKTATNNPSQSWWSLLKTKKIPVVALTPIKNIALPQGSSTPKVNFTREDLDSILDEVEAAEISFLRDLHAESSSSDDEIGEKENWHVHQARAKSFSPNLSTSAPSSSFSSTGSISSSSKGAGDLASRKCSPLGPSPLQNGTMQRSSAPQYSVLRKTPPHSRLARNLFGISQESAALTHPRSTSPPESAPTSSLGSGSEIKTEPRVIKKAKNNVPRKSRGPKSKDTKKYTQPTIASFFQVLPRSK